MKNYFNQLTFREKLLALGQAKFLDISEFRDGIDILKNKKIVIVGAGAQGLNQGLNMRDMGLDISYALRAESIKRKSESYKNAIVEGFLVGEFEQMIPTADLVINLTPDKQHTQVINTIVPLMKKNAVLSYSHGFNLVEEGMKIREDLTVIMVAPKSPGTEVREEFKRGFGVPTLIAVFPENDPLNIGFDYVKAYCYGTGGHRAGVLLSSFVAEVKSDLMGEQTILCGVLQTASLLCFDKMIEKGIEPEFASQLVQLGWETITEALKQGGITCMMDKLSNQSKLKAHELSLDLKRIMRPLFEKHMEDIITGTFSKEMMIDWDNNDENLLKWREETGNTAFEKAITSDRIIPEQKYFDHAVLMVAFVKAGVELAFEVMLESGIKPESAYYESLHETPLIANTIARKKLYEMNRVISDTAEYGCYLFSHACIPLLQDFMSKITSNEIGEKYKSKKNVDNIELITVNSEIREHPIEIVGAELRKAMRTMKSLSKLN